MAKIEIVKQDKISINSEKPIKKIKNIVGTLHPKSGHKVFSLDLNTDEIIEVKANKISANYLDLLKSDYSTKGELQIKEQCLYCTALNIKNAKKHFFKIINNKKQWNNDLDLTYQ